MAGCRCKLCSPLDYFQLQMGVGLILVVQPVVLPSLLATRVYIVVNNRDYLASCHRSLFIVNINLCSFSSRAARYQLSSDLCNDLKAKIENIAKWLLQNKLSLSTDKTEYMIVGHKRQTNRILGQLEVIVNGEPIKRAERVKCLGITVDENLTWNEQDKTLKVKSKMLSRPCGN